MPLLASSTSLVVHPRAPCGVCAGCFVWVSLVLACRNTIPCGLCVPRAQSGCTWVRAACPWCVCALALPSCSPLPPSPCLFTRALREVPWQGASRAVPSDSCPAAIRARVPCSACSLGGWGYRISLSVSGGCAPVGSRLWSAGRGRGGTARPGPPPSRGGGRGGGGVGLGWAGGQEQALGCGLPSLPHDEAELPDCPVPRPSGLLTATRPNRSAGGRKIPLSCV